MIEKELAEISEENLIPAWGMIELTHRCNTKCSHCYVVKQKKTELSTREVKNILDQLAEAGNLFLAFTGGEPFLRRDIFEILEYAAKKRFAVTVLTNATLLDAAAVKKLKKIGIHELSTSLYSLKAEVHDGVTRVRGSFVKVMRALKELKKAGIRVKVKCPLLTVNYSEKKALTDFAKSNGFHILFDTTIAPKNDGNVENTGQKIEGEVLAGVIKQHCAGWQYSTKFPERNVICSAGKNFIAINPYGEVLPCLQIPHSAGNIREKSLKEIWLNSPMLNKMRGMKLSDLKECVNCENIRYCNRCPGLALLESGSLYKKSGSACEMAAIRSGHCNG